jgi:hypothetical protein
VRPDNATYWWVVHNMDCGKGQKPLGSCGKVAAKGGEKALKKCKATCDADKHCGGFDRSGVLKRADCIKSIYTTSDTLHQTVWLLRDTAEPPPPPPPPPNVEFPQKCYLFQHGDRCYNKSAGYRSIAVNFTEVHGGYHGMMVVRRGACVWRAQALGSDTFHSIVGRGRASPHI